VFLYRGDDSDTFKLHLYCSQRNNPEDRHTTGRNMLVVIMQ